MCYLFYWLQSCVTGNFFHICVHEQSRYDPILQRLKEGRDMMMISCLLNPVDSKQAHLIKNQGMTACHLLFPLTWLMRKPLQQPGPETFLCFHKHQEQEERSLTSCHTVTTGQWMLPGPVVYVLPLLSLYLYLLQPSSAGANCLFALVYWTRGDTWRLEYNVQDRAALCYSRSFLACLL